MTIDDKPPCRGHDRRRAGFATLTACACAVALLASPPRPAWDFSVFGALGVGARAVSGRRRLLAADAGERAWFLRPVAPSRRGLPPVAPLASGGWACAGPQQQQQQQQQDKRPLRGPVVVVGTDCSGKRVVAKLLAHLSITVIVKSGVYGQMDVDGAAAGVHFTKTIGRVLAAEAGLHGGGAARQ